MKRALNILSILLFTCVCTPVHAQVNLVRNPSFEQHSGCPYFPFQVLYANYWTSIVDTGWSPDIAIDSLDNPPASYCFPTYYNECDDTIADPSRNCTLPDNQFFYHYPRTGSAMMGGHMYYDYSEPGFTFGTQQYIQGRLYSTLVAGQSYCVTFYVFRVGGTSGSGYAINRIGAYLDNGTIDTTTDCGKEQTEYIPQVSDTPIITDTFNWSKIQGSFIANGTESFITLGNFFDTAHTAHVLVGAGEYADYLVDDVSVIASNATAYAGRDTTITLGDTTWLGVDSNGAGMPCYWYVLGGTAAIDSGGSIGVAPTDTTTPTTYVVVMDLCGTVTYDTVVVTVVGTTGATSPVLSKGEVTVYPNPASGELNIDGAQGCAVRIFNVLGECVLQDNITTNKQTENISGLVNGVYTVQLVNSGGYKKNVTVLKE